MMSYFPEQISDLFGDLFFLKRMEGQINKVN